MNKKVMIYICIGIIVVGIFVGTIIYLSDKPKNQLDIGTETKKIVFSYLI